VRPKVTEQLEAYGESWLTSWPPKSSTPIRRTSWRVMAALESLERGWYEVPGSCVGTPKPPRSSPGRAGALDEATGHEITLAYASDR